MQWILHDWSDEDCVKILRNCKISVSHGANKGKVIIIDTMLQSNSNDLGIMRTQHLWDVYIMTMTFGKERNKMEWKAIFNKAGFSGFKIVCELGVHSVIEVYP